MLTATFTIGAGILVLSMPISDRQDGLHAILGGWMMAIATALYFAIYGGCG